MPIKRWASVLFVTCYLLSLTWGVVAHTLKVGINGNTLSYLFVWDMFCGWHAYDNRTHIVAEDADGNYYDVREPWGAFQPYSDVDRVHYDVSDHLIARHINHVISHTSHPEIDRVYVVQEIWPKQFNVPAHLWSYNFHEPMEKVSIFHLKSICTATGSRIESYSDWFDKQTLMTISDNPRLQQASREATPYYNTFFDPAANNLKNRFQATSDSHGLNTN
jgi:hypothetical protein